MKPSNTQERLVYLIENRKIKQVDILKSANRLGEPYGVKFNSSDISQYVTGSREPHQDKVFILSKALGVTVQWLMGFDYPMIEQEEELVTVDEKELLKKYRELNSEGQERLSNSIDDLLWSGRYQKNSLNELDEEKPPSAV